MAEHNYRKKKKEKNGGVDKKYSRTFLCVCVIFLRDPKKTGLQGETGLQGGKLVYKDKKWFTKEKLTYMKPT